MDVIDIETMEDVLFPLEHETRGGMHVRLLFLHKIAEMISDQTLDWQKRVNSYRSLTQVIDADFVKEVQSFDDEHFNKQLAEIFNLGASAEAFYFNAYRIAHPDYAFWKGTPIRYFQGFDERYMHEGNGPLRRPVCSGYTPLEKQGIERIVLSGIYHTPQNRPIIITGKE